MNQTRQEYKGKLLRGAAVVLIFVICIAFRWRGEMPPFDDAYHLKRITSLEILQFDPDRGERGAFTPWPPLYDLFAAGVNFVFGDVRYLPPVFFALFAAFLGVRRRQPPLWIEERRLSPPHSETAALTIAVSPYLVEISRTGHIDHHFVEPALLLAIVGVVNRPILLGIVITAALMVQPALIIAAGVAFIPSWSHRMTPAFAIPAAAVIVYRLTRLSGYPDSAWFLGYPHAGLLIGAAVACALTKWASKPIAFAAGAASALAFPGVVDGVRFFGGDPWLRSIVEFQPMFSSSAEIGTDLANLTGGAFLIAFIARRHRTFALFAFVYLLLALSSRRFLVTAIPLFAIAGAIAVAEAKRQLIALAFASATVLPPAIYQIATIRQPHPSHEAIRKLAQDMHPLPRGRVLGPWSLGHAIDVIGAKPVIIDNFGSMPDETAFQNAIDAMLVTRADVLRTYCHTRNVRYLVLPHPAYQPAMAATVGLDEKYYPSRRTVWSRLYGGEQIAGFTLLRSGAVRVWEVEHQIGSSPPANR